MSIREGGLGACIGEMCVGGMDEERGIEERMCWIWDEKRQGERWINESE